MINDRKGQFALFRHLELAGDSYEVGKQLGTYIRTQADSMRDFTRKLTTLDDHALNHVQKSREFFDQYCPEINAEIQGMAVGLGVKVEQLVHYFASYRSKGCCSQMVVLPRITKEGHVYLARNYDYSPQESDLCLITTRVKGKASHIGFSELGFGRNDGINEHGLSISMSNAAPGQTADGLGIEFWAVIRMVLDSCTNIQEATDLIYRIPTSTFTNFIVADQTGKAALIEVAGGKKNLQQVQPQDSQQYLCATNHFTSQEMREFDQGRYWDSVARFKAMESRLNDRIPYIDKKLMKQIQSDLMPLGTCCHHYSQRFGTLWAVIYDLTDVNMEACFGSPQVNDWHLFDLHGQLAKMDYLIFFPEAEQNPVWKKLPPGGDDYYA